MRRPRQQSGTALVRPLELLLVDDDLAGAEVAAASLREAGCVVMLRGGVDDAGEAIRSRRPDVVIVELDLRPDAGGVALARQLRGDRRTAPIGIVAMSATIEPEWPVMRLFDAYLRKPLDLELLANVVARLGSAQRARAAGDLEARRRR